MSILGDSLDAGLPPDKFESLEEGLDEGLGEGQDSRDPGLSSLEDGRDAGCT